MKKILFFASAIAGLFLAGSCQREMIDPVVEGGLTYTITLPEAVQTKGNSGYSDYSLHYEVYKTIDADALPTAPLLFEKSVDFTGNTATVSLDLLNDQDYTVLFWANKKGVTDTYFDLTDLRNVQLKTGSLNANDNDRDAFCGMDQIDNHDGSVSKTVKLTRPFAQVNIGTIVPAAAEIGYDVTPQESYVKISGVPVAYNVLQGKAVAGTSNVEFKQSAIPTDKKIGTDYTLVAMNYVLVPESNITVEYRIKTPNGDVNNTVSNVPVKKNYRTNIIGNLLTSNASYTVEILPGFETPAEEVEVWNGSEVNEPKVNAAGEYEITKASELAWLAKQVNDNINDFSGKTVKVVADIDLNNQPWTPIGLSTHVCFKGMFEGVALTKAGETYPTIKNLYIENGNCAGLFKVLCNGGKIKNINFDGAKISGERQLGVVAGKLYGGLENPVVENVTVENAQLTAVPVWNGTVYDNGDKVGGIAGLMDDKSYVKDCNVKNVTLKAYRDMGGIIGSTTTSYPVKITGNTVENLKFIVTSFYTPYMDDAEPGHYAAVRGGRRSNAGDVIENNTGDDITLHKVLEESTEGGVYDPQEKTFTVTSPAGLETALLSAGEAGAGDHTIEITGDLDMTGIDWTPIKVDGYNGADIVTVNGNGATIKGLDGALFAGGFAGGSGIVIKDLTIEGAYMIADNTQGYGAFVNCADSMDEITLINCHLKNSTIITPNDGAAESRIGGLVGWTAGYNNPNDGPVDSYITIKNCSVTGCTIKGAGSIGGICGHAGANEATYTTIEDCTVTGNTLISTDAGGWRVGTVVGTANNGQCVIKNITSSGNTCSQTGKTAPEDHTDLYGRFVPAGTGTLVIDGIDVALGYGKNDDGSYNVNSTSALNTVLSKADASVINLLPAEYKMPSTTNASEITINGVDGVVIDNTMGAYCDNAKLTFNNVRFKTTFGKVNGNGSDYAALYSEDVTYNECTFDGPMLIGRDGAKFEKCTFNVTSDYIRTYGMVCSFNECTFNTVGKALLIYSDGGNGAPAVSVTGCKFYATTGAKAGAISNQNCAAIEIHNYGYGVTLTTSGNIVEKEGDKFSGEWRIKTYETRNADSKIFVNGTEYTTIAIDGKTMTIDGTVVTVQD